MKKNVTEHNINCVKRRAKKLKKEKGLAYHEALDQTVQSLNYKNWKHFYNQNKTSNSSSVHSPATTDKLIGLSLNGFSNGKEKFNPKIFSENKKIKNLRTEIRKYFRKTKSFNMKASSYGLKHDFEKHIGEYVANGELIYAMYLEGYKIKRDDINCHFNISSVGLNNLRTSNKVLKSLNLELRYNLEDYIVDKKKFRKYKYHFNLVFGLLLASEVPKKNFYGIIGAEINETPETIKLWFSIEKDNDLLIPKDKLLALSEIFGIDVDKLKNF